MTCVVCTTAPATTTIPTEASFDDKGKPNGSKDAVCESCAYDRLHSLYPGGPGVCGRGPVRGLIGKY